MNHTLKQKINRALSMGVPEENIQRWLNGELIQYAMSELTDDEREYILTGILPGEWEEIFGEELQ